MIATDAMVSASKRFVFGRDTFAYPNELVWDYTYSPELGKMICKPRVPKPTYTHRCFVVVRVARQFLYHVRFDASKPIADAATYRKLARQVLARNPRHQSLPDEQIVIPGYENLHDFSAAHEAMLKRECGGAWHSYCLRSHWRMVFPISREHQDRTAAKLVAGLRRGAFPIVHVVTFPALTINHGMGLFDVTETDEAWKFAAYDPNDPITPATLTYDKMARTFSMPGNFYFVGGKLDIIEIFTSWWM